MSDQVSQQVKLTASIEVMGGSVGVGANPSPPNQLGVSIKNEGDAIISRTRIPPNLYLRGCLGQGEVPLFLNKEDARGTCTIKKPDNWNYQWEFPNDEEFRLIFFTNDEKLLDRGDAITLTLSNVISKTAPGKATLRFENDLSRQSQILDISKAVGSPDIIYFVSEPEVGVQNLPGASVKLKWRTHKLVSRELTQVGITDPLLSGRSFPENDDGERDIASVSADTTFRLRGYDGSKPIERELSVTVLRSGWYETKNILLEGDPGYPKTENNKDAIQELESKGKRCELEPTLLLNANAFLYAIFRHKFQGKERALLFETTNPFGGWRFVDDTIPGNSSTSPGVYYDDKIWLIGGSQIDQLTTSMDVYYFDVKQRGPWKRLDIPVGKGKPQTRMGHGVLAFKKKIWVMGGRNASGNALNDVWTLDVTTLEWNEIQCKDSWDRGRCLINPVDFKGQIWLYGGAQAPSSAELYDDLYTFDANTKSWRKQLLGGAITGTWESSKKPIASCLQVLRGRLHLFGKFRTTAKKDNSRLDEPGGFCLSDPATGTWERFPSDGLGTWGTHTTFSYQAVNFRDRLLICKALPASDRDPNPILKVYIPG
jgi:Galactose oxidase, central domain